MMIVNRNKSHLESMDRFHNYLYNMENEDYELLRIYDDLDYDVNGLESELEDIEDEKSYSEDEINEMKADIRKLVGRIKRWKRMDGKQELLIEELERILF